MSELEVIEVDEQGVGLDGHEIFTATRMAVRRGFMVNVPVVLKYPDGRTQQVMQGRVTPKGIAAFQAEMSAGQPRH